MRKVVSILKPALLPIWNGAHRLAWWAGELLDAVRNRRFERCSVCGRFGPILYRRWVIPRRLEVCWELTPRLADALARKESNNCAFCGAKLRVRRLAEALLSLPSNPQRCKSVARWVATAQARGLRVAEINLVEGLHSQLAKLPHHSYSDFVDGLRPGETRDGVRHEDLMGLTYADETFDLVITSETLEHVPDLSRALAEINRILVSGGLHVFTIPLLPTVAQTYARARRNADGTTEQIAEPICHPGGDTGYPVFTEFGLDVLDRLSDAGFESTMLFGPVTEDDLAQVFITRKRVD